MGVIRGRILYLPNLNKIKQFACALIMLQILVSAPAFAVDAKLYEIDLLRADLACSRNKNSTNYKKTKQKLQKMIVQNNIDYSTEGRLADVERLIKEQKYNSAIYELNELVSARAELPRCYELIGDILLKSGSNTKKASEYYKLSMQADPKWASSAYKLSKLYFQENKNIIGIEFLRQTVERTNDRRLLKEIENLVQNKITPINKLEASNLYEILGIIYSKINKKIDSYMAFEKSLQLNPEDLYLRYYLGDLFYTDNENRSAIVVYDSILREKPSESQIRASKAKSLLREGQINAADREMQVILTQYPESNQAKYGIYKIFEKRLEPEEILAKVNSGIKNYRATKDDCYAFAQFLNSIGDKRGAQKFIACAQKIEQQEEKKRQQELVKQAKTLEQTQNTKQAKPIKQSRKPQIKLKDKKTRENKESKETKENKALQSAQKQQNAPKIDRNDTILKQYLAIEPKTAQTYLAIANTYKTRKELDKAIYYYKEALNLEPTDSDLNYYLGLAYLESNKIQEARIYLSKSLNYNNQNLKSAKLLVFINQRLITNILNNAYAKYEKKDYIGALEILDNGIKEFPQNAQLYYYRAIIYDAMKRNAAQIIDLQKSIQLDPTHYMSYYQLGKAYEKVGDERSALIQYERFLSIEPEDQKGLIEEIQKKVLELGAKYY